MIVFTARLASIALLGVAPVAAWAESSASSAASNSVSASVGSSSTSIQKSSDSSSKNDDKVAEGDYLIAEVADAPARPGTLRLKLQRVAGRGGEAGEKGGKDGDGSQSADSGEFFLYLPQATYEQGRLAAGQIVSANRRPYGLEFTRGQPRQAFFLVLADSWYRELQTQPVRL